MSGRWILNVTIWAAFAGLASGCKKNAALELLGIKTSESKKEAPVPAQPSSSDDLWSHPLALESLPLRPPASSSELKLLELTVGPVDLPNHTALLAQVAFSENADYAELKVCTKDMKDCQSFQFLEDQFLVSNPPAGMISVKARACVRPARAKEPNSPCGDWKEAAYQQPVNGESAVRKELLALSAKEDEIRKLSFELYELTARFASKEEASLKLASDSSPHTRNFATQVHNLINGGPDLLASFLLSPQHTELSSQVILEATQLAQDPNFLKAQEAASAGQLGLTNDLSKKDIQLMTGIPLILYGSYRIVYPLFSTKRVASEEAGHKQWLDQIAEEVRARELTLKNPAISSANLKYAENRWKDAEADYVRRGGVIKRPPLAGNTAFGELVIPDKYTAQIIENLDISDYEEELRKLGGPREPLTKEKIKSLSEASGRKPGADLTSDDIAKIRSAREQFLGPINDAYTNYKALSKESSGAKNNLIKSQTKGAFAELLSSKYVRIAWLALAVFGGWLAFSLTDSPSTASQAFIKQVDDLYIAIQARLAERAAIMTRILEMASAANP